MTRSPLLGSNALPTTVTIGSSEYAIRHDFRDGIRFEELMYDRTIADGLKVGIALRIWFGEQIPHSDLGEVIEAILRFYRCGKPESTEDGELRRPYSFVHDYDLIYAAFRSEYGIDLLDDDTRLHWWKFRAMLSALTDDVQFIKVIGYRTAKPSKGMTREQRQWLTKMRRLHALPNDEVAAPRRITSMEELREVIAAIDEAKRTAAGILPTGDECEV